MVAPVSVQIPCSEKSKHVHLWQPQSSGKGWLKADGAEMASSDFVSQSVNRDGAGLPFNCGRKPQERIEQFGFADAPFFDRIECVRRCPLSP